MDQAARSIGCLRKLGRTSRPHANATGLGSGEKGGLREAESSQNFLQRQSVVRHDFAEDGAQGSRAERIVIGNGQVMLAANLGCEAAMRTDLP